MEMGQIRITHSQRNVCAVVGFALVMGALAMMPSDDLSTQEVSIGFLGVIVLCGLAGSITGTISIVAKEKNAVNEEGDDEQRI